MRNKKILMILLFFLISFISVSCGKDGNSGTTNIFEVVKVIDGDTFIIDDEHQSRVRMLGIDTPEISSPYSPGEPFSEDAKKFISDKINNGEVRLEYGKEKFDSYGRVLAYVFIKDDFLNEDLLKNGFAWTLIYNEKQKYNQELLDAEKLAKKDKKGIWRDNDELEYPDENRHFVIKPVNARRHVDQRVVTRGKVTETRGNKHVLVMEMENDLDIVIFRDNIENFQHFGINPENYYTGQPVEVIGKVTVYRGRTQIAVHHPIAIRKLK